MSHTIFQKLNLNKALLINQLADMNRQRFICYNHQKKTGNLPWCSTGYEQLRIEAKTA